MGVPETVILGNAIKATNPCIIPLFYQTWGKRDGDSQNCGNHELFCSYEGSSCLGEHLHRGRRPQGSGNRNCQRRTTVVLARQLWPSVPSSWSPRLALAWMSINQHKYIGYVTSGAGFMP